MSKKSLTMHVNHTTYRLLSIVRQWLRLYWPLLLLFLTLAFCFIYTPNSHDDWLSYPNYKQLPLIPQLWQKIIAFPIRGGRFFVGSLIQVTVQHFGLLLYNFLEAAVMVIIPVLWVKVMSPRRPTLFYLCVSTLILAVSDKMLACPYFFASFGYFPPLALVTIFYLLYQRLHRTQLSRWARLGIFLLAFATGNWMEHIGFAFVVLVGVCFFYKFYRTHRPDCFLLTVLLGSAIGLAFAIFWPSLYTNGKQVILSDNSYLSLAVNNLYALVQLLLINNKTIIITANVIFLVALFYTRHQSRPRLLLSCWLVAISWLVAVMPVRPVVTGLDLSVLISGWQLLVLLSYPVLLFYLIVFLLPVKMRPPLLYFFALVLLSFLPILPSRYVLDRTLSFALWSLILFAGVVLDYYQRRFDYKHWLGGILVIAFGYQIISVGSLYWEYGQVKQQREQLIKQALVKQQQGAWDYEQDYLVIPHYGSRLTNANYNPSFAFFPPNFWSPHFYYAAQLRFYGLHPDTRLLTRYPGFAYKTLSCGYNNIGFYFLFDLFARDYDTWLFTYQLYDGTQLYAQSEPTTDIFYVVPDLIDEHFTGKIIITRKDNGQQLTLDCPDYY